MAGRCDLGRVLADGSSQLVVYMYTDHTSMHAGRGSPAVPFPVTLFVLFTHGGSWMDWVNGYTVWLPVALMIKGSVV